MECPDESGLTVFNPRNHQEYEECSITDTKHLLVERGQQVTADDLATFCREQLTNYKVPKAMFIREELPMLPIGKLDRRTLKNQSLQQLK